MPKPKIAFIAALCLLPGASLAGDGRKTVSVDLDVLPAQVRSVGTVFAMAQDAQGRGQIILRRFKAGETGAPHRPPRDEVRVAVVVEGTIHHGLGETYDRAAETAYGPGSVLLMEASDTYWLAARDGDASLLFVFVPPEQLAPEVLALMHAD